MKIKIGEKTFELTKEQIEKGEDVTIDGDFLVRTKDEEERFLDNIKSQTAKAAIEIEVKKMRSDLGLDFQGKSIQNLVEALTEKHKVEFTKEPSELVAQKEKDIELLKGKLKEIEAEKQRIDGEFSGYRNNLKLEKELKSVLPKNLSIPEDDVLMILRSKLNPTVDGDRVVFKKGDDILKDPTTLDPLPTDKVIANFFAENKHYLKGSGAGSGGQDEPGLPTGNSVQDWKKRYEASGGDTSSEAMNKAMMAAIAAKEIKV
jgi:hypothetical protein